MASIERSKSAAVPTFKVYWDLPRSMVPAGQTRAKGSVTVYDEDHATLVKAWVDQQKNAVTGDEMRQRFDAFLEKQAGPKVRTFEMWSKEFLRLKKDEVRSGTLKNYGQQLGKILPVLGDLPIADITNGKVKGFLDNLKKERKITNKTCDRYYALITHMFELAVAEKWIEEHPLKAKGGWKLNKPDELDDDDSYAERYFEPDEFMLLLKHIRKDYRLFVEFLVNTGARFSEATNLRVRDLNPEKSSAWIRYVMNDEGERELPKSGKKRLIEVRPTIMAKIVADIEKSGKAPDDLVFTTVRGSAIGNSNFLRDHWKPAMIKIRQCPRHMPERIDGRNRLPVYDPKGISTCSCLPSRPFTVYTPHALRHTYATLTIRAGRPIAFVSHQLGHATTKVTETIYTHLSAWWEKVDAVEPLSATLDELFSDLEKKLQSSESLLV